MIGEALFLHKRGNAPVRWARDIKSAQRIVTLAAHVDKTCSLNDAIDLPRQIGIVNRFVSLVNRSCETSFVSLSRPNKFKLRTPYEIEMLESFMSCRKVILYTTFELLKNN